MVEMESSLKAAQIEKWGKGKGKFIDQDKHTKTDSFSVGAFQEVNLQQSAKHRRSLHTKKPVDNIPGKQDLLFFDVKKSSSIASRIEEEKSIEEKIVLESCQEGRHGGSRRDPGRERTDEVLEDPKSIKDDNFWSEERRIAAAYGKEKVAFWESIGEASAVEKARLTGPANTDLQLGLSATEQEPEHNVDLQKCGWKTSRQDYEKLRIHGASKGKQKLLIYNKAEHCLLENPGSWIFQDETRHLCITTAGKKLRNMIGGFGFYDKSHPREMNAERTVEVCFSQVPFPIPS